MQQAYNYHKYGILTYVNMSLICINKNKISMSRIDYVNYEKSDQQVKKAYDDQKIKAGGYVTNMKRTLLRSLPAYNALMEWFPLHEEISKFLDERSVAIFCHSISSENECILCSLYFRKELKKLGIDPAKFELSDKEELLATFGRQIARDSKKISNEFFDKLKLYFNEEQIVALVGFAVIMVATNLVNNTLDIEIDDNIKPE